MAQVTTQGSIRRASNSERRWSREEDILALDLFVRSGLLNGGHFLGRSHPLVIELSNTLRLMPVNPEILRDPKYRNPDSVELKLMNFRAVEFAVKHERGIAGAESLPRGMRRFSVKDRTIFEEYFDREFQGLAEDANEIREALTAVARARVDYTPVISVEDRPVDGVGAPTYETAGTEGGQRSRAEHELVSRYAAWLASSGIRAVSRLYRTPGLVRPFLCDLFLPEQNVLIEAKSNDSRTAIRMAIGQLMDYRHFETTDPALAILLPYAPSAEVKALLVAVDIGIVWPFGRRFTDSMDGAYTRR